MRASARASLSKTALSLLRGAFFMHPQNCVLASARCHFHASDVRVHADNCVLAAARCIFYACDVCAIAACPWPVQFSQKCVDYFTIRIHYAKVCLRGLPEPPAGSGAWAGQFRLRIVLAGAAEPAPGQPGAWTGQFLLRIVLAGAAEPAPGRPRGLDWSVSITIRISGSSRAGSWPARGLDCSVSNKNRISGISRAGPWPARGLD